MKMNIKSAFAFMAVALMIMVAVVPMVSVFSDDSQAAEPTVITDPTGITDSKITIKGTVYAGTVLKEVVTVTATYKVGGASYTQYVSTTSGAYTIVIYEDEVTDVTISVESENHVFTDAKFGILTAGSEYTADFYSTYQTISGTLKFANDVAMTSDLVPNILNESFSVYLKTDEEQSNIIDESKTIINENGTYVLYIPVDALPTSSTAYTIAPATIDSTYAFAVTDVNLKAGTPNANIALKCDYGLLSFTADGADLTFNVTPVENVAVVDIVNTTEEAGDYLYFAVKNTTTGSATLYFQNTDNYGPAASASVSTAQAVSSIKNFVSYYKYTGKVNAKVGSSTNTNVVLGDGNTVLLTFTGSDASEKTQTATITGGIFSGYYPAEIRSDLNNNETAVTYTVTVSYNDVPVAAAATIKTTEALPEIKGTYTLENMVQISGKIVYASATTTGVPSVPVKITTDSDVPVFGVDTENNVKTNSSGMYYAYIPAYSTYTVTPVSVNGSVYSQTVIQKQASNVQVDVGSISMKNKAFTTSYSVKDAAGNVITTPTAYIVASTSATTALDSAVANDDGTFTFTVAGNVDTSALLIYFTDSNYEFDAESAATAASVGSEDAFKATNQKYTISVVDYEGNAITLGSTYKISLATYTAYNTSKGTVYTEVSMILSSGSSPVFA